MRPGHATCALWARSVCAPGHATCAPPVTRRVRPLARYVCALGGGVAEHEPAPAVLRLRPGGDHAGRLEFADATAEAVHLTPAHLRGSAGGERERTVAVVGPAEGVAEHQTGLGAESRHDPASEYGLVHPPHGGLLGLVVSHGTPTSRGRRSSRRAEPTRGTPGLRPPSGRRRTGTAPRTGRRDRGTPRAGSS